MDSWNSFPQRSSKICVHPTALTKTICSKFSVPNCNDPSASYGFVGTINFPGFTKLAYWIHLWSENGCGSKIANSSSLTCDDPRASIASVTPTFSSSSTRTHLRRFERIQGVCHKPSFQRFGIEICLFWRRNPQKFRQSRRRQIGCGEKKKQIWWPNKWAIRASVLL